jgi:hypothetical protein
MIKKNLFIAWLCGLLTACATTPATGPSVEHGFSSALSGLGHLLLSPLQIAAGLLEGIASVPYYLATNLNTLNQGLIQAQAHINLEDTYQSAYGKSLAEVPPSGDTGVVFTRMQQATQFFQKILQQYGVYDSQYYLLTSIEDSPGENVLLSVVYRPFTTIEVVDKHYPQRIRSFSTTDRLFYEPFRTDNHGKPLDTVIDWAAFPKKLLQTQKAQAILLTLAANSVLNHKKTPDYWEIEPRWLAGEAQEIVRQRTEEMNRKIGS